jgi:hypothetical protein
MSTSASLACRRSRASVKTSFRDNLGGIPRGNQLHSAKTGQTSTTRVLSSTERARRTRPRVMSLPELNGAKPEQQLLRRHKHSSYHRQGCSVAALSSAIASAFNDNVAPGGGWQLSFDGVSIEVEAESAPSQLILRHRTITPATDLSSLQITFGMSASIGDAVATNSVLSLEVLMVATAECAKEVLGEICSRVDAVCATSTAPASAQAPPAT